MEYVDPIKSVEKLNSMKELMLKDNKIKECVLFTFGINSGLRVSDLLNLKWSDVVNPNKEFKDVIKIKEIKTGKTKLFPLNNKIKAALQLIINKYTQDDYIFKSESNRTKNKNIPWGRKYVWEYLSYYGKMVGIENIGTHTMRKTFGYHAYKNGVSLELIQKIFNHASSADTLRYIGITQQEIDNVYIDIINL